MALRDLRFLALSLLLALVVVEGQGKGQKGAKRALSPVILRYKGEVGGTQRYRAWFILRMIGIFATPKGERESRMEYRSEAVYLHKILGVEEDGTLEIETTKESGKAQVISGDQTRALPDRPYRRVIRMTPQGRVVEERVVEGESRDDDRVNLAFPIASPRYQPNRWLDKLFTKAVHNIAFPERPIKPGDSWGEELTEQMTPNYRVTIRIVSHFKEWVRVDGRLCALIESSIEAPIETEETVGDWDIQLQGRFIGVMTLYFDPKEGTEVQAFDEGRLVLKVSMSGSGRPTLSVTHKLISRGKMVLLD